MIRSVIRCRNDMVMVFDENGEQLPEYQGNYIEVKDLILRDVESDTTFSHTVDTGPGFTVVQKEDW